MFLFCGFMLSVYAPVTCIIIRLTPDCLRNIPGILQLNMTIKIIFYKTLYLVPLGWVVKETEHLADLGYSLLWWRLLTVPVIVFT